MFNTIKKELPHNAGEWVGFCCICAVILTIVGFIIFFIAHGVIYTTNPRLRNPNIKLVKYGIEFKSIDNAMCVINKTDKILRVHCVWQFRGETTVWIKLLSPGQRHVVSAISHQHIYYVYDQNKNTLLGMWKWDGKYRNKDGSIEDDWFN